MPIENRGETSVGESIVGSTPEQFSRFVAEDTDKWRKVVRVTGFVME